MAMSLLRKLELDTKYGMTRSPLGVSPREFEFPADWAERTKLAVASADNAKIPRCANAGAVEGEYQVMHNGIRVRKDGYYGAEYTELIEKNRGVHEPQEERVFQEVLPAIRAGGLIVELGAYWAFYSTWFLKSVANGRAILVEPDSANLEVGKETLRQNGVDAGRAMCLHGWVGRLSERHQQAGAHEIVIDELVRKQKIEHIDVLHCDAQGSEAKMLLGADETLKNGKVSWIFLSTHSMHLHGWCRRELLRRKFVLVAEADLPESYSYDGLLVFKRAGVKGPEKIEISQRKYPELK